MSLTPGTRLGPYEIVSPIGAGGMGEVYRARDTKLNRVVALKILPEAFTSDADRLARFHHEAQVLASLNHPHIAAIYGFEDSGATHALVMELVEGEDLSAHIARGPIALADALLFARQIADALETAHEQGIIHRDLKPANVKVRADGTVKVLDFGLAKAFQVDGSRSRGQDPSSVQTTMMSPAMTQHGMILGTAAYMAPEQARGKAVDKRADIWAFGVVLFEMLTGCRAFAGDEMSEVLASVLKTDPDWSALPVGAPPAIQWLLRRCLEKDPRQRLRDIGDARVMIDEQIGGAPKSLVPAGIVRPGPSVGLLALTSVTAALGVIVAVWALSRGQVVADRSLVRLDVDVGADVAFPQPGTGGSSVAISPDGSRLAWVSGRPTKLFTRRLDQRTASELPGTEGATVPFFSADGKWIGFIALNRVQKTSVDGGAVVQIADVEGSPSGARWAADGTLFVTDGRQVLRVPADSRVPETVGEAASDGLGLYSPEVLPGGQAVLVAADRMGPVDVTTIEAVTIHDHRTRVIVRGGASPRLVATSNEAGYLVYVNHATLLAIPFDSKTLETRGTAVPVLDDVANEALVGTGQFDVSATGTLVYRRASPSTLTTLQWLDASGRMLPTGLAPGVYVNPAISPDGRQIAATLLKDGGIDVWTYDLARRSIARLTAGEGASYPRWSPDGRFLVCVWAGRGIFQLRADGAGPMVPLSVDKNVNGAASFSADGRRLAFVEQNGGTAQIVTAAVKEEGGVLKAAPPEPFLSGGSTLGAPSFSPDGRWLAYQSSETGTMQVYARPFPGPGGRWSVSTGGGEYPVWSRTKPELFFLSPDDDRIMVASYTVAGDALHVGTPQSWGPRVDPVTINRTWDLDPNGARLVVLTRVDAPGPIQQGHEIVFLQHFGDYLRTLVPGRQ